MSYKHDLNLLLAKLSMVVAEMPDTAGGSGKASSTTKKASPLKGKKRGPTEWTTHMTQYREELKNKLDAGEITREEIWEMYADTEPVTKSHKKDGETTEGGESLATPEAKKKFMDGKGLATPVISTLAKLTYDKEAAKARRDSAKSSPVKSAHKESEAESETDAKAESESEAEGEDMKPLVLGGKKYLTLTDGSCWHENKDGSRGKWAGKYDSKTKKIDSKAVEPEVEEE